MYHGRSGALDSGTMFCYFQVMHLFMLQIVSSTAKCDSNRRKEFIDNMCLNLITLKDDDIRLSELLKQLQCQGV